MWLDTVVIDKIGSNGSLQTIQLRPGSMGGVILGDLLENIDTDFRDASVVEDIGPLRVYENDGFKVTCVASTVKNIALGPDGNLFIQYDHFHIPVFHGYFAVIFPRGWRLKSLKIYDPYDDKVADLFEKRCYEDVDVCYSTQSRTSFAQLNMRTREARQLFSIGIVAEAAKIEKSEDFLERECREVQIEFTDPRHGNQFRNYHDAANRVAETAINESLPPVNVGFAGPLPTVQTDIVGWLKSLRNRIRPAPR